MAVSEAEQQVAGMFWIWYTLLSLFLANYFMVSVFGPAVKFLHFKCVFLGKAVCSISWQAEENLYQMTNELTLSFQTPPRGAIEPKIYCYFEEREEKTEKEFCLQQSIHSMDLFRTDQLNCYYEPPPGKRHGMFWENRIVCTSVFLRQSKYLCAMLFKTQVGYS